MNKERKSFINKNKLELLSADSWDLPVVDGSRLDDRGARGILVCHLDCRGKVLLRRILPFVDATKAAKVTMEQLNGREG